MRAHKILAFSLVLVCWAVFALLAARMQPDSSSLAFFPDDAPQVRRMARALDVSPASGLLFIDLFTERPGGKYALASTADAMVGDLPPELAERVGVMGMPDAQALMALLPYFTDEATLAQLQTATSASQIDTSVRAAHDNLNSLLAAGPAQEWLRADPLGLRQRILSRLPAEHAGAMPDPVLGYPVSADGKHLLLVLRPAHSLHDVSAAALLMDAVHASMQKNLASDMQGLVVGGHRHSAVNAQVIQRDITNIVFFSMLGFVLVYALLVRSRGVLWLMLVPAFAASFALGGMTLLSPALSGLALGFGASVLGVAEDYAVHMHFALRSGDSAESVLGHITPPLFQGYLVNASGFAVLLLSGIPAVRQLALFALLTLSAGFALAVIVLPVCPWFNTPALPVHKQNTDPRRPAGLRVFLSISALLLLCYALFSIVQVDVSPRTMGADMAQLQQDGEKLKAVWGSRDSNILVVEGKNTDAALAHGRAVVSSLRALEPENKLGTLTDVWPSKEQAQANVMRWEAFAAAEGPRVRAQLISAAQRHGFTVEAFVPFIQLIERPVAEFDPSVLRAAGLGEMMDVFLHGPNADDSVARLLLFTTSKADVSRLEPALAELTTALAPGELEATLLQQLDMEKRLVPLAWLACLTLLFLYFRDVPRTLLASLPPLCSVACILAWMSITSHPLTLAGMAAMPLVLGLAADHGIVVTHDLVSGVKMGVERAVVVSSLTTFTGMGLLALAQHPALKAMGEVIFWGLIVEVPVALWLLPMLCRVEGKQA
ncbi:hypothetical protein [Desulfovibrio sp.]|uniref:hypothetical protein n=1 Tax=Desulfovibrio sp. TaxID=885 RepID=UPI0025BAA435|nr:hypothetical protein [Desulfovibrio sp.]